VDCAGPCMSMGSASFPNLHPRVEDPELSCFPIITNKVLRYKRAVYYTGAKYICQTDLAARPNTLWATDEGGQLVPSVGWDSAHKVAIGPQATVYVTGFFEGSKTFDPERWDEMTLSSAGGSDGFVAALSPTSGSLKWVRRFGGAAHDQGHGMAIDAAGNMLVSGYTEPPADFGAVSLEADSKRVGFIAAVTTNGTFSWVQRQGETGDKAQPGWYSPRPSPPSQAIAAAGADTNYAAGSFLGNLSIGGEVWASRGGLDMFVEMAPKPKLGYKIVDGRRDLQADSDGCAAYIDGCPAQGCASFIDGWGDDNAITVDLNYTDDSLCAFQTTRRIAGARCCGSRSDGRKSDGSQIPAQCGDSNCKVHTFAEARALCRAQGGDLCTEKQVLDGAVAGSGCWYDLMHGELQMQSTIASESPLPLRIVCGPLSQSGAQPHVQPPLPVAMCCGSWAARGKTSATLSPSTARRWCSLAHPLARPSKYLRARRQQRSLKSGMWIA
jgi:hypothetical protein